MSYEYQSANGGDPFDTIVAGMSMSTVVHMNGKRVILDPEAGIDFQAEMFRVQADAITASKLQDEQLDEKTAAHLDRMLHKKLQKSRSAIRLNALVAIGGSGLYLAGDVKAEEGLEPRVLTAEERLFGVVESVGYNSYPVMRDSAELPEYDEGITELESRDGLVMVLASTMICAADDDGQTQEWFRHSFIPLTEQSLVPYAADILK